MKHGHIIAIVIILFFIYLFLIKLTVEVENRRSELDVVAGELLRMRFRITRIEQQMAIAHPLQSGDIYSSTRIADQFTEEIINRFELDMAKLLAIIKNSEQKEK